MATKTRSRKTTFASLTREVDARYPNASRTVAADRITLNRDEVIGGVLVSGGLHYKLDGTVMGWAFVCRGEDAVIRHDLTDTRDLAIIAAFLRDNDAGGILADYFRGA